MATYGLRSGLTFTVPPAPIDDKATDLLALALEARNDNTDGLEWGRRVICAVLRACCPDVFPKVTLADVVALAPRVGEMLNDAWGCAIIGAEDEPKNAPRPAAT